MATKKYKLTHDGVTIGNGTEGIPYSLSYEDGLLSLLRDGVPVGEPIDIFQNNQPSDIIIRYSSYDVNNPSISNDENDIDYYDYYDHNNCELCIENCEACDRAWHKQFEDDDVWMAIGKTLENGDPDLAWSFIRVNTKDGEDGEDGKDGSPIVSVYFNPSIITYPSGGHRDYNDNNSSDSKIEIFAYKGTTRVKVIALRDTSNNPITLNTTESLGEIVSQIINSYRADDNSPVKFIATVLLDVDEDENDITLNYIVMLNKQEITNPELDNYMLVVTPNVLVVDVDLQIGYTLTGKLYQNGNEVNNPTLTWDYSRIANNHNGNTVSVSQQGSSITITSDTLSTTELNNSDFIECSYIVNGNQVILKQTIPFLRNSQLILSKYLIRDRGKWTNLPDDPQHFESYRNDSLRGHTLESNNYIDVVWWDCNSDDDDAPRGYYMPKLPLINPYEPVTYPVNSEESLPPEYFDDVEQLYRLNPLWQKAISMDFAYIRTLIAETISAHSVQANEVLIIKKVSNQLKIVAGMTSSDRINPNESSVRIWAGTTNVNKDLYGKIDCNDLTLAPFRVYEDGKVVMNDAIVTMNNSLCAINSNLLLPEPRNGLLGYLIITDKNNLNNNTSYIVSSDVGVKFLLIGNNSLVLSLDSVNFTNNGVYMFAGYNSGNNKYWAISYLLLASTSGNATVSYTNINFSLVDIPVLEGKHITYHIRLIDPEDNHNYTNQYINIIKNLLITINDINYVIAQSPNTLFTTFNNNLEISIIINTDSDEPEWPNYTDLITADALKSPGLDTIELWYTDINNLNITAVSSLPTERNIIDEVTGEVIATYNPNTDSITNLINRSIIVTRNNHSYEINNTGVPVAFADMTEIQQPIAPVTP